MSWSYLKVVSRSFSVGHAGRARACVRGSSVNLPIALSNGARLPLLHVKPHMFVVNPYGKVEHEATSACMVDARSSSTLSADVRLGHVGVYVAGVRGVVLSDPLQLFSRYITAEEHSTVVSTPQDHLASAVELSNRALSTSAVPVRTVLSDDVDYAGTRDYEYGDPLKSVHWKLSARTQELQTRLFESSVNTRVAVVMDFHAPAYNAEQLMSCNDCIVEGALGVMRLALGRNMEARLCYADKDGQLVSCDLPQTVEMEGFVTALPQVSAHVGTRDALGALQRETEGSMGCDCVVYCCAALTRDLMTALVGLVSRHRSASVLLAIPQESVRSFYRDNRGLVQELAAAGIPCVVVHDSSQLEGA